MRGAELRISPITPASAPVVLGEELRDLGAAIAVRLDPGSAAARSRSTARRSGSASRDGLAGQRRRLRGGCARRLEPGAYGYYAGGAGDEHTLRANAAAFARWELRPRVLVDVGEVSTATTVLGTEVALPLLVAPTAFQRLADPEGELATARAAAAPGR